MLLKNTITSFLKLNVLGVSILVSFNACKEYHPFAVAQSNNTESEISVLDPVDHVNPFLGTAPLTDPQFIGYDPPENWRVWAGLTFPGSSLPNAMVQLSPITEYGSGAGYEYEDDEIYGFTHTNKGHWNLCNIPILPMSNGVELPLKSKFDKSTESASPAFYGVTLTDFDVQVKLTSTLRCGFHEYNFKNNNDRRVIFDLQKANNRVIEWHIDSVSVSEVSGYQKMGRNETVYFFAKFNDDIASLKIIEKEKQKFAQIDLGSGSSVVDLKIGLSYVSVANARENLESEIAEKSFSQIENEGKAIWRDLLNKVKVEGGNSRQNELFYSSLYRSFLWPALRSDNNGDFIDNEGNKRNENFSYYTTPSLWDTYRNKLVLLGMLRPEVTGDVIQSMIIKGEASGFMPTFFHGDHAAPFIANAYAQGIKNFDANKAYQLLLNNAYKEGPIRPHLNEYISKGYISDPKIENPNTETKANAGVSKTLEYALDDYSLAKFGQMLNETSKYEDLMNRSKNYKNLLDPNTQFMRGRLADGSWIKPFNAEYPYYEYMYREANAWQLSFYAPHDMKGLVEAYGGMERFESKLDSLFSFKWNPDHIARNVSSFIGQYSHGNQPDHEAPFAYYYVNKPEKSQKIIDNILENFYGVGKDGLALSGMDDAGEMSSWFVFAASGIYPVVPADNEFLISIPIFKKVTWTINDNEFVIYNDSNSNYLQSINTDFKLKDKFFIKFDDIKKGGNITIITKKD